MKAHLQILFPPWLLLTILTNQGKAAPAPAPSTKPKEIASFQAHELGINRLAFSPDGKILITAGGDILPRESRIKIKQWKVADCLRLCAQVRRKAIAEAKDPPYAPLATSEHFITLHACREYRGTLPSVDRVGFAPDGKRVFFNCNDGLLRFCDALTGEQKDEIECGRLRDQDPFMYSPDRQSIVFGSCRVDLATKKSKPIVRPPNRFSIDAAGFDPKGKLLAAFSTGRPDPPLLVICEEDTQVPRKAGRTLATYRGAEEHIIRVVFHPDGKTVIAASLDNLVHVWDWTAKKNQAKIDPFPGDQRLKRWTCGLTLRRDGRVLALDYKWGNDEIQLDPGAIQLYEIPSGKLLATLQSARPPREGELPLLGADRASLWKHRAIVLCVAFSADGKMLAAGNLGGVVTIWRLPDYNEAK